MKVGDFSELAPPKITVEYLIMRALIKSFFVFFVAMSFILFFFVSCASTAKREGTGEYIDDSVITARVKAAILGDEHLKVAEINVETFKGIVQLSGFVSSADEERKAVKVANDVGGVKSVKDDMRIK